jgi:hypothetical protein
MSGASVMLRTRESSLCTRVCRSCGVKLAGLRVERTADEAGEENGAFGSASWKEGGVPNAAENAETGAARDEETEAAEVAGVMAAWR